MAETGLDCPVAELDEAVDEAVDAAVEVTGSTPFHALATTA